MIKYVFKLIILMLLMPVCVSAQQDGLFTQNIFNQGYINPGYYGTNKDGMVCATLQNRIYQKHIDDMPVATIFNINSAIELINSGVGLSVYKDKLGYLKTYGLNLGYSYLFHTSKGVIGVGGSAGFINGKYNQGDWMQSDGVAVDENLPQQSVSKTDVDLGVGLYYNSEKLFAGLSFIHLQKTFDKNDKTSYGRTMYFTAGYKFIFGTLKNYEFRPSLIVGTNFEDIKFTLNSYLFYRNLMWIGISYRYDEAVSATIGLELMKNLRLGYSYDFLTREQKKYSNGIHEVYLSYKFNISALKKNKQIKSIRYL